MILQINVIPSLQTEDPHWHKQLLPPEIKPTNHS